MITFLSYYSEEELTGIGKYNGEFIEWIIHTLGEEVLSISSVPFYPYWNVYQSYQNKFYQKEHLAKYQKVRTWVYIPSNPNAIKKMLSEFSFFVTSIFSILMNFSSVKRSKLIIVVLPPFFLNFIPIIIGRIFNIKILTHIQDLQVDAARELNLLPRKVCDVLEFFEKWNLKNSDYLSTISSGMKRKLERKKLDQEIILMPNWADIEGIKPIESKWLHHYLNLGLDKKLIVYSGNLGEKQGLEIVVDAAKYFQNDSSLHFVILGEGLYKMKLEKSIDDSSIKNLTIGSLVPKEMLNEMLCSSFIQMVIQKSVGADSFLPSKLTNILSSGTAAIITASPGTTLHDMFDNINAAYFIPPDDPNQLIKGIDFLLSNPSIRKEIQLSARSWAEKNLSIGHCLNPLLSIMN